MRLKHYIVALFIFVSAWNSLLMGAGGIMVCLYEEGTIHANMAESPEICCHSPDTGNLIGCGNCVDIELEGINFLMTRNPDLPLPACTSLKHGPSAGTMAAILSAEVRGRRLVRGPPPIKNASLRVAESIVLRL